MSKHSEPELRRRAEEHDLATLGTPEERARAVRENVREMSEAQLRAARREQEASWNDPPERIARALERIADALEILVIRGEPEITAPVAPGPSPTPRRTL